jgi:hypothetical protein
MPVHGSSETDTALATLGSFDQCSAIIAVFFTSPISPMIISRMAIALLSTNSNPSLPFSARSFLFDEWPGGPIGTIEFQDIIREFR